MVKVCPKCGYKYSETPAISREDGETAICPDCGLREALNAWKERALSENLKTMEGADEQG